MQKCTHCKADVPKGYAVDRNQKKAKKNARTVFHYACAGWHKNREAVVAKKPESYKWVIELEIDPVWVADGFEADEFHIAEAIRAYSLGYAYPHEVKAKILKRPSKKRILKEQGFES